MKLFVLIKVLEILQGISILKLALLGLRFTCKINYIIINHPRTLHFIYITYYPEAMLSVLRYMLTAYAKIVYIINLRLQ